MAEIRVVATEDAAEQLLADIRRLMDDAFDNDFDEHDWDHTLGGTHAVVLDDDGSVLAHAAVVERSIHVGEHAFRAGYVEGVATAPGRQRQGFGTMAMTEANAIIRGRYELGALGTGEWHFYERLGWERWQGETFVRHVFGAVRSPGDDDGVMVLRFGPSAGIDLTGPIACETRPGDDW